MHRSTLFLSVALTLGVTTGPARAFTPSVTVFAAPRAATNGRKNIAIGRIEGPKSSKIRLELMQLVRDSAAFSVTDAEDLKSTSGRSAIAKMASALDVDAVVLGTISNSSNLTLHVYKADGRLVEQVKVKGGSSKKLEKALQTEFDDTVAPALAQASGTNYSKHAAVAAAAPVEEEAEPEAQPAKPKQEEPPPEETAAAAGTNDDHEQSAEDEEEASEAKSNKGKKDKAHGSKPGRTPLELDLGLRGYSRNFEYTDAYGSRDPSQHRTLAPYKLPFAPAFTLAGVFYPGAFFDDGVLGNIGLMGSLNLGFATKTDYVQLQTGGASTTTELKTKSRDWDLGVRGRISIGPVEIALFAEDGIQTFILLGDEGGTKLAPLVPDVQYTFVRLGAEPRVRLGRFTAAAHIAPRILTSLHQIDLPGVWFPGAKGRGLDFGLMVGYGITSFLELVGGGDFVRYGFDFNDLPTSPAVAPVVAGGATDRYWSGWIAVRLRIPGSETK